MKKKRSLLIIMSLVFTLFLTSCGVKPETSVDTLLSGMKSFDIEKIHSVIDPDEGKEGSEDFETFEDMLEDEDDSTKAILEYCKEKSKKIEYKILDSKVDKDKAVVNVHVKYVDGTEVMSKTMSEFMQQGMALAFSGGDLSEENSNKIFTSIFNKAVEETEDTFTEKDLKINLINKENKWYIKEFDDELLNIVLVNFIDVLGVFNDDDSSLEDTLEKKDLTQVSMNDTLELATINVKVNSIEESDVLLYESLNSETKAIDGAKFVLLNLDVKNITKKPLEIDTYGFTLRDSEHRYYSEYDGTIGAIENYINMRNIGPSLTENGIIVYEVPQDAKDFSLIMTHGGTNISYEMKLK